MSQHQSQFNRKTDEEIGQINSAEKPAILYESNHEHVVKEDAVFGEVVEGGPNYRNVGIWTTWQNQRLTSSRLVTWEQQP